LLTMCSCARPYFTGRVGRGWVLKLDRRQDAILGVSVLIAQGDLALSLTMSRIQRSRAHSCELQFYLHLSKSEDRRASRQLAPFRSDGSPRANICLPHLVPSFFCALPARQPLMPPFARKSLADRIFFAQTSFALGELAYCFEAPCAAKSVFGMEAQNVAVGPRPRTFSSRSPLVVAARRWLHFRPFSSFE
jgi:hypothetical protein